MLLIQNFIQATSELINIYAICISLQTLQNELKVFSTLLHGHLAATGVAVRQFRDGKLVRTIDEDRHYDFNYQQYKMMEKPITIKPVSKLY